MCLNSKHILEVTFIEKLSSYINLNKLKGGRIMFKTYSMELAGRPLTIETGKFAGLANADVVVRYGYTNYQDFAKDCQSKIELYQSIIESETTSKGVNQ